MGEEGRRKWVSHAHSPHQSVAGAAPARAFVPAELPGFAKNSWTRPHILNNPTHAASVPHTNRILAFCLASIPIERTADV